MIKITSILVVLDFSVLAILWLFQVVFAEIDPVYDICMIDEGVFINDVLVQDRALSDFVNSELKEYDKDSDVCISISSSMTYGLLMDRVRPFVNLGFWNYIFSVDIRCPVFIHGVGDGCVLYTDSHEIEVVVTQGAVWINGEAVSYSGVYDSMLKIEEKYSDFRVMISSDADVFTGDFYHILVLSAAFAESVFWDMNKCSGMVEM